jgi:plastocyanin
MRKFAFLAICVLMLSMLAACGNSSNTSTNGNTGPYKVTMGGSSFDSTSITIPKGSVIEFATEQSGTAHDLVIGTNGLAHPQDGAPDFGSGGHIVGPGQTWTTDAWNTAGTFSVTCTYHPMMNLTVTVTG